MEEPTPLSANKNIKSHPQFHIILGESHLQRSSTDILIKLLQRIHNSVTLSNITVCLEEPESELDAILAKKRSQLPTMKKIKELAAQAKGLREFKKSVTNCDIQTLMYSTFGFEAWKSRYDALILAREMRIDVRGIDGSKVSTILARDQYISQQLIDLHQAGRSTITVIGASHLAPLQESPGLYNLLSSKITNLHYHLITEIRRYDGFDCLQKTAEPHIEADKRDIIKLKRQMDSQHQNAELCLIKSSADIERTVNLLTTKVISQELLKNGELLSKLSIFPAVPDPQQTSSNTGSEELSKRFELVQAAASNDIREVRRLIEAKVDVNIHALGGGKAALHYAVEHHNVDMVRELLKAGADVNSLTQNQFTPLHVAAQRGFTNLIRLLAGAGAKLDAQAEGNGCTPLHEAAAKGHKAAVLALLECKANLCIREGKFNLTAANLANEKGHIEIRDILVNAMSYQDQFMQNINYILFSNIRGFLPETSEHGFLQKLRNIIITLNDADSIFKEISKSLKSEEFTQVKDKLAQVRQLLIANMNQYNRDKLSSNTAKNDETNRTALNKP